MNKIAKILILVLSLTGSAHASFINGSEFVEISNQAAYVYGELESSNVMIENGYFSAGVLYTDETLELTGKVKSKKDLKKLIKDSMFTVFAYSDLSNSEQNMATKMMIDRLDQLSKYYEIEFYTGITTHYSELNYFGIESSCDVGGPSQRLYITLPQIAPNAVLVMSSDVCD